MPDDVTSTDQITYVRSIFFVTGDGYWWLLCWCFSHLSFIPHLEVQRVKAQTRTKEHRDEEWLECKSLLLAKVSIYSRNCPLPPIPKCTTTHYFSITAVSYPLWTQTTDPQLYWNWCRLHRTQGEFNNSNVGFLHRIILYVSLWVYYVFSTKTLLKVKELCLNIQFLNITWTCVFPSKLK